MKEPKNNTPTEDSSRNRLKEATSKLFTKRIDGLDAMKQELLLKLYNEIIEDKK